MDILGIDVGGSNIKAAVVDTALGRPLQAPVRVPTERPATPASIARQIAGIARDFDWKGPVGCGLPAVVRGGTVLTAANIDSSWIGTAADRLFAECLGLPVTVVNDADAAGLAEMRFGAGRDQAGTVILVTIGTGLGSAVFHDGVLLPNTELGHLPLDGRDAEELASDRARKRDDLSWEDWAGRFNRYLALLEGLFFPDLFLLGGGLSHHHRHFFHLLRARAPIRRARLLNDAGVVGAALAARAALDGEELP
ncbi:polyphosphate glucokinase [Geothermobacter ehrlichii]|uniref:Polyphosphate glucokinase n=1 Tax=Geothermobacter ehrlichii TaxID=213224 RepID=A0A5D3WHT2_9BACT|nr:polyphosphate glucokinase [Geothermobacter ehrlichii]